MISSGLRKNKPTREIMGRYYQKKTGKKVASREI